MVSLWSRLFLIWLPAYSTECIGKLHTLLQLLSIGTCWVPLTMSTSAAGSWHFYYTYYIQGRQLRP